jgi:hypothetical protein
MPSASHGTRPGGDGTLVVFAGRYCPAESHNEATAVEGSRRRIRYRRKGAGAGCAIYKQTRPPSVPIEPRALRARGAGADGCRGRRGCLTWPGRTTMGSSSRFGSGTFHPALGDRPLGRGVQAHYSGLPPPAGSGPPITLEGAAQPPSAAIPRPAGGVAGEGMELISVCRLRMGELHPCEAREVRRGTPLDSHAHLSPLTSHLLPLTFLPPSLPPSPSLKTSSTSPAASKPGDSRHGVWEGRCGIRC